MLTREQVSSVYRQVLGRTPNEEEIASQLASLSTLDEILRAALDSEEYAVRLRKAGIEAARQGAVVNVYHPDLAAWTLPAGTRSEDEIAIVGSEGWLFLCGGTNANLDQYVGAAEMEAGWRQGWRDILHRRDALARELEIPLATLIVPDKLAVYEQFYPEALAKVGPRPVEVLLSEPELPLVYPLEELRASASSGEEAYLRTDTHLTFRGNQLLFESVAGALGVKSVPDFADLPFRSYPIAGDLGVKFDPQIVSIVSEPGSLHQAQIVEDNRAEIEAVQGHIGTRRVFRNDRAVDPRTVVLFGDSFGFGAPSYQGISWFLAQVFREVRFVWIPFGWDPDYLSRVGAEAVLVQGAERFVARVPRLQCDVPSLAEETLRRKQPVDVGRVFGDQTGESS